jgi:hypothetical protein
MTLKTLIRCPDCKKGKTGCPVCSGSGYCLETMSVYSGVGCTVGASEPYVEPGQEDAPGFGEST